MSMIHDIKTYLAAEGITDTIYAGLMADSPDDAIALYQYAGQGPLHMAGLKRPGLQVRTRSKTYTTALDLIEAIATILNQVGDEINGTAEGETISGTRYLIIRSTQSAFQLGEDDHGRTEFAQNFYVTI